MTDLKVREVMSRDVATLSPDDPVKQAAKLFVEKDIGGAPVADKKGKLIGIVTEADLIMQDVKIHFPTYVHFLDSFIYLESFTKFEENLKKAVGAKVKDVMTKDVTCVGPDDLAEDAATLMVERGISRLPVLEGEELVGIVTKRDIVKAISKA